MPAVKLNIQKWGNSAAIRLPKTVLMQMNAKVGDVFDVTLSKGTAKLRIAKPRYRLADLLAECDPNAPPPVLDDWDRMEPVGGEVW